MKQEQDLGVVLVFEDLTELIKAQKVAAWQEVARRVAHEIKNPLTPIQLSAQRMRKKFFEKVARLRPSVRRVDQRDRQRSGQPQAHGRRIFEIRPPAGAADGACSRFTM